MAAATSDLKLGTGVLLPLEHDLFDLAKCVSTLDHLCGGRLMLGVGVGWNAEELANCRAVGWSQRYRALDECVDALKTLWRDEEAEFHGRFFDFDPVWSEPKPRQHPHPPLLCGMAGRLGTRSAVSWADGWMPLDIGLGNVERKLGLFRAAAETAGRAEIPVTIVAWGDPTFETLLTYADLGVERVVLGVARAGLDEPSTTPAFLDTYAPLIERLR
jgi:probable F420-dependent oxidoreductase